MNKAIIIWSYKEVILSQEIPVCCEQNHNYMWWQGSIHSQEVTKFAVNKVTIIWSHREAIHIKEVKAVCCVQGHLSLINLEYTTTYLTCEKWSWLRLQNPNMGNFLDILDTQKKSEFQVIPNFKDSEFEET